MTKSTSATPAAEAGTVTIGDDLTVNRLGYGAMRVTGDGIWGEPDDLDKAKDTLRRVVSLGINFIDTADSYGPEVSENLLREALAPYPDDLVIATKGGLERTGPGEWPHNARPEHLQQACEGSLRRLGVDCIDVYQLHRPDPQVPLAESIGALVDLQQQGKVRHLGVSNVDAEQLAEITSITPIVSVQNRYNVGVRESEKIIDLCQQQGLVFLPWAPMHDFKDVAAVREIANRHDATVRQIALAWLLARSPAVLPIPGTGSVAHVEENAEAATIDLSADEIAQLTAAAA